MGSHVIVKIRVRQILLHPILFLNLNFKILKYPLFQKLKIIHLEKVDLEELLWFGNKNLKKKIKSHFRIKKFAIQKFVKEFRKQKSKAFSRLKNSQYKSL